MYESVPHPDKDCSFGRCGSINFDRPKSVTNERYCESIRTFEDYKSR